jgi:hypothetical protein
LRRESTFADTFPPTLYFFVADVRRSASPGTRSLHRQGSVLSTVSGAGGASLGLTAAGDAGTQHLTPQQFGVMGELREPNTVVWGRLQSSLSVRQSPARQPARFYDLYFSNPFALFDLAMFLHRLSK